MDGVEPMERVATGWRYAVRPGRESGARLADPETLFQIARQMRDNEMETRADAGGRAGAWLSQSGDTISSASSKEAKSRR
jgi:hypothetical protein